MKKLLSFSISICFITLINAQQPTYNFYDTQVLASANGMQYTAGTFNKGLQLGEFILGQSLLLTEASKTGNTCVSLILITNY